MILASLLLKLGGYGFYRFLLSIFTEGTHVQLSLVIAWCTISIIHGSLVALRQTDFKKVIAYSSIAHMNSVLLGLCAVNIYSLQGAVFLMIAHGIVSGALFFLLGSLYERYWTRSIQYYGGLASLNPKFCALLFIFSAANMGFPGTANFVGEFLIFVGVFRVCPTSACFAGVSVILSAAYSLFLYNRIALGPCSFYYESIHDLGELESFILVSLSFSMLILGVAPNWCLDLSSESALALVHLYVLPNSI